MRFAIHLANRPDGLVGGFSLEVNRYCIIT